ncbi:proline/glycine betaine ABC transporter permease [Thiorhodococcus mannitoliphagus]|uniref:Proline/glycine betaine ABC transporter permease n=1 Tax=Thiorhodococcus mannitoliphagus TaxID=329406 RepID=A0A6P1DMI4_9GAMM|nr:proline/glycine betaine ABC transporter permease [Thiorhodococcus mannitoliphagus]NEX18750.1 proline/glycine betaine ABC transporter permease [Thiorhodococcus mannitoliphagus]
MIEIPPIPLAEWIDDGLDVLTDHFADATKVVSDVMESGIEGTVDGLMWLPPWVTIIALGLLAWRLAGVRTAVFAVLGFALLWNLGLWEPTLQTLVLVLMATLIAVAIGTPLGVAAALSSTAYRVIFPVLDFMQTMPAFVYLIPAIPFFGLGPVAAVFSTVIFAMPPAIRLTTLGIRQVPADLVEAADAFGSTKWQKLTKVQLPLAVPTIMAGINQTIMLALSMVVIAAMIGAQGLGGEVWRAIQRNEAGMGFEAGIAVVILAMVLDRITQGVTRRNQPGSTA